MGGSEGAAWSQLGNYVGDSMDILRKAAQQALDAYDQHDPIGVVMADLRAALAQPEQDLQSFAQDWDAPGMEAYDDPPLTPFELTRFQQMRSSGYTRRPRQLPKEDEQEPEQLVVGASDLPTPTKWTPQRKPLTDDQIAEICMDCSLVTPSDIYFARAIEKAHGIE